MVYEYSAHIQLLVFPMFGDDKNRMTARSSVKNYTGSGVACSFFGEIAVAEQADQLYMLLGPDRTTYLMRDWNGNQFG